MATGMHACMLMVSSLVHFVTLRLQHIGQKLETSFSGYFDTFLQPACGHSISSLL